MAYPLYLRKLVSKKLRLLIALKEINITNKGYIPLKELNAQ
jgi:hypothetical protein